MAKVNCTVNECSFWDRDVCTKHEIVIQSDGITETDCGSFLSKQGKQTKSPK